MEMNKLINKVDGKKVFRILDMVAIVALLIAIADTVLNYSRLPESVPMHLDMAGNLGNYSSDKSSIFIFIGFGAISYIATLIVAKFPQYMNYTIKITDENKEIQYALATKFIKVVGFEVAIGLAYFQFSLVRAVISGNDTVGPMCTLFVFVLLGTVLSHVLKSRALR